MEIKTKGNQEIQIDGRLLKLTNLGKVFWPEEGYTKGDLLNYYVKIAPYLLPYLQGRPESLLRYPNGIKGKRFFQKNINGLAPEWMQTVDVENEEDHKITRYMICDDLPSLLFMINLGCIDINPWNSRVPKLDHPDYLIIDLDPEDIEFRYVVKAALAVKEICDSLGVRSFPKTSGASGMHIWIPLGAKYTYEQCRQFAEILAHLAHNRISDFTSLERSPKNRQGRIYLDYLQNARGQTLAAPYCVRPRPLASVSTPLAWEEVQESLLPTDFTIKNIFDRLKTVGDPFSRILDSRIDLEGIIKKIGQIQG